MLEVITIGLVSGAALGALSAIIGKYLDALLDYGSILGSIRFKIALWYAGRAGEKKLIYQLVNATSIEDYHERLETINAIYWQLTGRLQRGRAFSWFTGWICIVCLTSRVALLAYLLSIPILLKLGAGLLGIFIALIVALGLSNAIVSKL